MKKYNLGWKKINQKAVNFSNHRGVALILIFTLMIVVAEIVWMFTH